MNLDAYLRRIEHAGETRPSRPALEALHLAHATHIVFENIDVVLGVPIRLDLPSIEAKLVANRRGGYCFEQNALFAAALGQLGFSVTTLAARVRLGTAAVLARTHMMLLVEADGERLLADVGFGAEGLLLPIPLVDGKEAQQYRWRYRVVAHDGVWVLQSHAGESWKDLYAFTLERQYPADYELASYYTSTHPASRFVQTLTAQRLGIDARRTLRDRDYSEDRGDRVTRRTLASDAEVLAVLSETFGLQVPQELKLRYRR